MAFKESQTFGDSPPNIQIGGLEAKYVQWRTLKNQATLIEERLKDLRDEIMVDVQSDPEACDDTGSYWKVLDDGSQIKCERRVTTTLKPVDEVRAILEGWEQEARVALMNGAKGDQRLEDRACLSVAISQRVETYVDQDYLYDALQDETITEDELKSLFDEKITWYFKPQKD